ncbi:hypothetical protein CXQ85_001939 [Candidozyma haemuli]|uniref:Ribosomal protein S19 n=1 Tax=Candidozyma haemuli TaxID=45357 RepID=A0A2V1AQN7_9ASCO|nr:hypothetical protein CXQ85_001939 [[Candida] haemuloni]PVH20158.1 hypothetical protein CXQ85_001939 [[Candida] haemuloni]
MPSRRCYTRVHLTLDPKTMKAARVLLKGRSAWKGPSVVPLPIANAVKTGAPIRTNARSCTILPQFVGLKFQVHNGKEYVEFEVTDEMVGSKLGEFSRTRKPFSYKFSKN